MLLLFQIFLVRLLACDISENDENTQINPGCNYAGICRPHGPFNLCECCEPTDQGGDNCGEHWTCDPENPLQGCVLYSGRSCSKVREYFWVDFGFRLDPGPSPDMYCKTDPFVRFEYRIFDISSFDIGPQVQKVATDKGWPGTINSPLFCDTCTPTYPCTYGVPDHVNATSGGTYSFQVNLMEYYNLSCSTTTSSDLISELPECEANYDFGQIGYFKWSTVRGEHAEFIADLNTLLKAQPDSSNDELGLGWTSSQVIGMSEVITFEDSDVWVTSLPTFSPTHPPTQTPTPSPSQNPTQVPTMPPTESPTALPTTFPTGVPSQNPTESPTALPTTFPTGVCERYVNQVEDLVFEGVGSNCRAGLNTSWPGGLTCDSPYIVCLPEENTNGEFGGEAYKSATYRYSVDECLQECANDQRCMGVEFVADSSSALGNCNLIDDIPLEIDSMVDGFTYDPEERYPNLDSTVTNGSSMCFVKQGACNPQFEAKDLSEDMLNCYCPNNRKGSYTKKVKRTVDNTRFCGDDVEVDVRIQKAQANRMFHLCENWCLFHTDVPKAESWYWDPWQACWREQYAGSYCSRVIINPDTIEMQFVTHRSNRSITCQSD